MAFTKLELLKEFISENAQDLKGDEGGFSISGEIKKGGEIVVNDLSISMRKELPRENDLKKPVAVDGPSKVVVLALGNLKKKGMPEKISKENKGDDKNRKR